MYAAAEIICLSLPVGAKRASGMETVSALISCGCGYDAARFSWTNETVQQEFLDSVAVMRRVLSTEAHVDDNGFAERFCRLKNPLDGVVTEVADAAFGVLGFDNDQVSIGSNPFVCTWQDALRSCAAIARCCARTSSAVSNHVL